jgi:hypothetical protein
LEKRNKVVAKAVNKLALWSATMIFFGVLFYWVDYERGAIFAARFWWLLWVILADVFDEVVKFFLKEMPRSCMSSNSKSNCANTCRGAKVKICLTGKLSVSVEN